ncbi:hypothetical protein EHS13_08955 [Paenibacillus psychroresistens]|uniref:Extracellular solute-binding protein n=1 Tax=Paenibacillus psychroresistens TaxID=1778678 RepID=A0A6B8RHJ2_9BACL|nr:hypothetical protein [Paenibacillus psychroresistens]QGQ95003.1 hypothetical protein EHS13_08955 [Paenibacillus psychroresistens]
MNKKLIRSMTLILTISFIMAFYAGCTKTKEVETTPASSTAVATDKPTETTAAAETTAPAAGNYYEMLDKVADSSELPDWTGKQLTLKAWYTHGSGDAKRPSSSDDVVTPEIKRVTGVTIDKDGSFDNGGQDVKVKMGMLNASNDWPEIAFVGDMGPFKDMIEAGKVYDLTDALQKYAPNMQKRLPISTFPLIEKQTTNNYQDGKKVWGFPALLGNPDNTIKALHPEYVSPNPINGPQGYNWIWVRDDILKMMYPSAKSQDEIDALYVKNGKFTKEDIFDVPIKSHDDFIKFLYDVQKLIKDKGLKENGKPMQVSYANGGQDNWSTMTQLFGNINRLPANNNYFTYYDKLSKTIKYSFQQDFFKAGIKEFNKLVRDGIMDPNSLLENNASHLEKLNNGQYAVPYLYDTPDASVMKAAGKTYRYRKLWIDAPVNFDTHIAPLGPDGGNYSVMVFKDKVKEEDLPQVIRYLDYLMSDVGEKMYSWGPKSAGLFDETDGKRIFKDKDLEAAMVYNNQDNGAALKYNLFNTRISTTSNYGNAWPYYPAYMWGAGPNAPLNNYVRIPSAADALGWFDPGNLPGNSQAEASSTLAVDQALWAFFGAVPSADAFWKNRDAFEKTLTKTLAAKDDAQFESMWKAFQELAVQQGATEQSLKEYTDYFLKSNKDYIDKIK